jgi:hypothetical protein
VGLLDKVQKQKRGPWNAGWYSSVVSEELIKRDGSIQATSDYESSKGDSRNLCLIISSINQGMTQTNEFRINYRPEALFDEARRNEVIADREKNMRDHISLERLKDVEEAFGTITPNGNGGIDAHRMIGRECRAYLGVFQKDPSGGKNPLPVKKSEFDKLTEEERGGMFNMVTQVGPAKAEAKKP